MARTKQTARKSCGGKAPRKMMQATNAQQLRQFMTGRQAASYAGTGSQQQDKTSYLNYENMFYSYSFPTGAPTTRPFEPRFTTGAGKNPVTGEQEWWVGMSFNSMYDGPGMKTHGRPHLNLAIVLDISGSMGTAFDQDYWQSGTSIVDKLTVAKQCLESLTDQLKPSDQFGLVRFNDRAEVHCPMKQWRTVNKTKLKREISNLRAYGATCLSAAIDCATDMFHSVGEHSNASNRVIFLTDLCSTVDSANDERKLLSTIKTNADRGIYTTVVGIGMDLNVRLVEEISKTRGAKYCSVDSTEEFRRIMNQEFDYDVTILAFNIRVQLQTTDYFFAKGYGSPEVHNLKRDQPVVISSEFPSWQNEQGESKGGMILFKLDAKKGKKTPPRDIKVKVTWEDLSGVEQLESFALKISNTFEDKGTRKAALLVHYVDLHNDYVHDRRQHKTKFLELFQMFRSHFVNELEEMKDKSLATSNKGDLELLDKIIELESKPDTTASTSAATAQHLPSFPSSTFGAASSFQGPIFGFVQPISPNTGSLFGVGGTFHTQPTSSRKVQRVLRVANSKSVTVPKRLQRSQRRQVSHQQARISQHVPPNNSTSPTRRSVRIAAQSHAQTNQPRKRQVASPKVTPRAKKPRTEPSIVPAQPRQAATDQRKQPNRWSKKVKAVSQQCSPAASVATRGKKRATSTKTQIKSAGRK